MNCPVCNNEMKDVVDNKRETRFWCDYCECYYAIKKVESIIK